jgi:hypothetical protein
MAIPHYVYLILKMTGPTLQEKTWLVTRKNVVSRHKLRLMTLVATKMLGH